MHTCVMNGNFLILIQAIVTYLIIIITYSIVSAARSTRDTISNVISGAWWHKYFAIFLHKFVACSATFNLTVHATFCLAIYQKIAKILFFMNKKGRRSSKQAITRISLRVVSWPSDISYVKKTNHCFSYIKIGQDH